MEELRIQFTMDIVKALRELYNEKKRLDAAIASLEARIKGRPQWLRREACKGTPRQKKYERRGTAGSIQANDFVLGESARSAPDCRLLRSKPKASTSATLQRPEIFPGCAAWPLLLKEPQPKILPARAVPVSRIKPAAKRHVHRLPFRKRDAQPRIVRLGL